MNTLVVTEGDRVMCLECYAEHVQELDVATWRYASRNGRHGETCPECGMPAGPGESEQLRFELADIDAEFERQNS